MRRRALLASALPIVTVSGCSMPFTSTESYPKTVDSTAPTGDISCPNRFDTKHTVCSSPPSHGPPVSLKTNTRTLDRGSTGVPAVRATLSNDTRDQVSLPVRELRHYRDGEWRAVTGWYENHVPTIAAGETRSWSLSLQSHPTPRGIEPVVHNFRPGYWSLSVVVELTPEIESQQDIELSTVFAVIESEE